ESGTFRRKYSRADVYRQSRERNEIASDESGRPARGRRVAEHVSQILHGQDSAGFERGAAGDRAGGALDFAAAEYSRADAEAFHATGGARRVFERLREVFFAMPRRAGDGRGLPALRRRLASGIGNAQRAAGGRSTRGGRRKSGAAGRSGARVSHQRAAAARTELDHLRRPVAASGGIAAQRSGTAGAAARAISLYSGGRIPGHEYRATRITASAGGRCAKHRGGGRRESGDLSFSRRVVRELHDFLRPILWRGEGCGRQLAVEIADAELPVNEKDIECRKSGDSTQRASGVFAAPRPGD